MSNVRVTELDFDQIKDNLKTYLRNQSQFTDYDFDGSNMNVLIDLLAYNTHYNAVLANMVNNEMFLDTAIKRSSVASLSKHLGYIPRSARSSRAVLTITVQNITGNPNYITLERYTPFMTTIDGVAYTFYTTKSHTTTPVSGVYTFENVEVWQGRYLEYYYTVGETSDPSIKYAIPNKNVDTQSIYVAIQYNGTSGYSEPFMQMNDLTQADATSKIYYLEENTDGLYQIYFGDNVLGKNLSPGDTVKIGYLISDGAAGNVSTNVPVTWTTNAIAGETGENRSIATVSKPSGGLDQETVDEIRFNSISRYSTQGRAITGNDYASIISSELPGAESVNVWGGEDNNPPEYGKVFVCIKPRLGYVLTDAEKTRIIETVLKPRSVITSMHEFVDPIYTYLNLELNIKYNSALTNKTAGTLSIESNQILTNYINTNLSQFNSTFYSSQVQKKIMANDDAIVTTILIVNLQKRIKPTLGEFTSPVLNFPASIHPAMVKSNYFYYRDTAAIGWNVQIRDVPDQMPSNYNGTGTLKLYDLITGSVLVDNLGSVNYATGQVKFINLKVDGYIGESTDVRINVETQETGRDITPGYNEIIALDDTAADSVSGLQNGLSINVMAL